MAPLIPKRKKTEATQTDAEAVEYGKKRIEEAIRKGEKQEFADQQEFTDQPKIKKRYKYRKIADKDLLKDLDDIQNELKISSKTLYGLIIGKQKEDMWEKRLRIYTFSKAFLFYKTEKDRLSE